MLNSFFSQCFNHSLPLLDFSDTDNLNPVRECPDELLCDVEEIHQLLSNLDINKANCPDNISARMLKATAPSIAPSGTQLFNLSLRSGCVPCLWKVYCFVFENIDDVGTLSLHNVT